MTRRTAAPAPSDDKPPRRTHAERREEAEARLLDAALEIVARRGSVRMTLAEVGEVAGYSRGLASARFGSKAQLLHALAAHIGRQFGEQLARGPVASPGLAAVLGNIDVYFSRKGGRWTSTRALLVMMTEACMEPHEGLRREIAAYNRQVLSWFEEHLRIGIDAGEISHDIDPAATAVVLMGALRGVMLQWLIDDRIKLGAARDQLLKMTQAVLRPQA